MDWCIFPIELVTSILSQSDPRDVIRWRTVSKWFRTVTDDIALWRALHVNATFPRPPGPFRTQSKASLELDLVRSAQLAQSWMTRPLRVLSSFRIDGGPLDRYCNSPTRPAQGRWLITCEHNNLTRLVLHDMDSKYHRHSQRILWELDKDVYSYNVKSLLSVEGDCFFYVLIIFDDPTGRIPNLAAHGWCLLEFRLDGNTGEELSPPVAINPPPMSKIWTFEHALRFFRAGQSRFVLVPTEPIFVFDAQECVSYELPPMRIALDENEPGRPAANNRDLSLVDHDCCTILTDSHIICLWHDCNIHVYFSLIQVFMLPPDNVPDNNGKRVLRLTHEGHFPKKDLPNAKLMNKPSTDPLTGTTTIKLLNSSGSPHIDCIELVLPEASVDSVLSISGSIKSCSINISFPQLGDHSQSRIYYLDPFYEDHIIYGIFLEGLPARRRGLKTCEGGDDSENFSIVKFTIDVSKDSWVFACGEKASVEQAHEEKLGIPDILAYGGVRFDGTRGKMYFSQSCDPLITIVADIE